MSNTADPGPGVVPPQRRIFTNRNLRMESIEAIGFDMDHTLAVYNTKNFNHLCFDLALERMISDHGYDPVIRTVRWDPDAVIRGLIVDKEHGNLLKLDAYNHVTRARRGFRFLDKEEIREVYSRGDVRLGSDRYRIFDTLFDMPEGCIFSGLMELKENGAAALNRSPGQIYDEIRKTVDTMHADGTLKARIIADLGRFFIRDSDLLPTLQKIHGAGKKIFLLTNSEADYTAAVMDFLIGGEEGSWEELFDLVICFARKPGYFLPGKPGRSVEQGSLPLMPNRQSRAFIGGDCFFLEKELGVGGDEILYFGDHTYGDILSSKKSVGWRTAMIVPEVEQEVENLRPLREQWKEIARLEETLDSLVLRQDQIEASENPDQEQLNKLRETIGEALGQRSRLQKIIKAAYNPYWDSLFREGRASSRFGRQTMEFACIYTSRVSNFLNYPADKFFARHLELQPHERWALENSENHPE